VVFFPDTCTALRSLQSDFLLFIVTNQVGISEGTITPEQATAVNAHVVRELSANGIHITQVYTCPHSREDGCCCIKPQPYFLEQAMQDHAIDLSRSYTVGDHPHDVELAHCAGAREGILVLTGHGRKHRSEVPADTTTAATIAEAAALISADAAGNDS
jgi:histidinol-phosphate phosphatase family protein